MHPVPRHRQQPGVRLPTVLAAREARRQGLNRRAAADAFLDVDVSVDSAGELVRWRQFVCGAADFFRRRARRKLPRDGEARRRRRGDVDHCQIREPAADARGGGDRSG